MEADHTLRTESGPPSPRTEPDRSFFGHPRGLSTLFFTEMWERFSYYGMRAILILFMTASVADGGLGFDVATAGAIYGLYTAAVYLTALPGGWLADRWLGQQGGVLIGGIIIAIGHFTMALPAFTAEWGERAFFYAGLVIIVIGTGFLKPCASTMVGELYEENDERRDAGFSIFYMGINLGAFIAPLVTSYLGERVDWHLGFGAAGVGMTLGVVQYVIGRHNLGDAGRYPHREPAGGNGGKQTLIGVGAALGLVALIALMSGMGIVDLSSAVGIASTSGIILLLLAGAYFLYVLTAGGLNATEKKRVVAIIFLFLFSAIFWAGYEQTGSSLNLFARDMTDRVVFGWLMPTGFLQSVNSLFIITLAPIFAWIWIVLARRKREPNSPAKFAIGLVSLGAGFIVMAVASAVAIAGGPVSPGWLVLTYLLHSVGELALSPVGLSTVTKLAPRRMVGQMMGIWFLSLSLGNVIAGQVAGLYSTLALPGLFGAVAATVIGAGLVLLLMSRWIARMMGGVR